MLIRKISCSFPLYLWFLIFRESHPKNEGFCETFFTRSNLDFFRGCRLSRDCFEDLHDMVSPLFPAASVGGPIQPTSRTTLLLGLWYLATTSTYREISDLFGLSTSTVYKHIDIAVDAIAQLSCNLIVWPDDEIEKVEADFRAISGFPGIIGAIDGCHVPITAPLEQHRSYQDRTMGHSVTLLACCDASLSFTYVFAGFPGSAHDQRVTNNSDLPFMMNDGADRYFKSKHYHLIGDSAFTLSTHMMVPYKDHGHLTQQELRFNHKLSLTRRVIENAFAWLKGRFRRLKRIECQKVERVSTIILAACVLHNLALQYAEPEPVQLETDYARDASQTRESNERDNREAKTKRDKISRNLR